MPVGDGWELAPGCEPWSDFHWYQASPRASLVLVVLSEAPVWYTGHYVGGRMVPCIGAGCDCCAAAIGAQVRYAVAVAEISSRRTGLIEFGRSNGLALRDWAAQGFGLRGMTIEVVKHTKSVQSRTEVRMIDPVAPSGFLALEVPDPSLALYLTWHKAGFAMPAEFRDRMAGLLSSRATRTG